jgi:hypothetical protein
MSLSAILFPLSALLFVGYLVYANGHASSLTALGRWKVPAILSLLFLLFSLYPVWMQGPMGFLDEHTRTLWSSQIWFDLLLGVSVAWWWMAPHARALGMRLPLWMALVIATGNIGLLAMLARLWWLQEHTGGELAS